MLHERVDHGDDETRGGLRVVRGLNIYSRRLGLSGKADVVEFHERGGEIVPFPVEYKSGKPKRDISDLAQVCAQALCLEEMTLTPVRGRPFIRKTLQAAACRTRRRFAKTNRKNHCRCACHDKGEVRTAGAQGEKMRSLLNLRVLHARGRKPEARTLYRGAVYRA